MPLTLHEATIPSWLQVIDSVDAMIDKAVAFAAENNMDESELVQARLIDDMLPFSYQVKSCWGHSGYAIEAVRAGEYRPEMTPPPGTFAELKASLDQSRNVLNGTTVDELESIAGNDMVFAFGEKFRQEYTVQDFLLSFTNPNFYFHATTAYDILRMKGVPVGKRDFLGATKVKA
ncbi:DUF1993 domain-containing protein [Altererythrobacter sp. ZODW24]|uniref:DUF1993 domain-containing protein n=1 Tax=Altererythrobacter sp. ZODW24 TaxID=2185142 RepID=UPI000DF7691C|nr:DUF1993 domain-containing protein [Altererythrobacter sp. ZODW24]